MNKAKKITIVDIEAITPNPKNRNKHSPEQIQRLKQIIEYQGFRVPVVISNQTKRLVAGHGRLLAAKELGLKTIPAIYQDFESEEQEYTYGISDNSIAEWAEIDLGSINVDIQDLGPFDLELLGLESFEVDIADKIKDDSPKVKCDACGQTIRSSGPTL